MTVPFRSLLTLQPKISKPSFESNIHLLHTGCATDTRTQAQQFCQPFARLREFCKLSSNDPNTHGHDTQKERTRIITHALTGGQNKGVYRTHYVVTRGSSSQDLLNKMVQEGLMTGPDDGKILVCYRVTRAGAQSVGLDLPPETLSA